jgi:hypothetical protein
MTNVSVDIYMGVKAFFTFWDDDLLPWKLPLVTHDAIFALQVI